MLLAPVLERQHELLTPRDAAEVGVHRATITRLRRSGYLEEVEPRVYRRAGAAETWKQRLLAVLLSLGSPAVASHRAAARLLQVPTYEAAALEISVSSKRGYRHADVIVHESRDIRWVPPILVDGIPCTPPRRLAVDIGAVLGDTAYGSVLRELRRTHAVTWKQLAAILVLHSRQGRNGCGPLRRQLERYYGVEGIPDTALEQQALDHLIDAWLPLPVIQHVVPLPGGGHYRLDFAYPSIKLAIEIDGPHHGLPEVAARDRQRDRRLQALGWVVLRFDEQVVAYRPELMVHRIRRALEDLGAPTWCAPQRLPDP